MQALGHQIPVKRSLGWLAADEDGIDGVELIEGVVGHGNGAERHLDALLLQGGEPFCPEGREVCQIPAPVEGLASALGQQRGELRPVSMIEQAEGQLQPLHRMMQPEVEQVLDLVRRALLRGR